ncbi:hypothetical protein IQ243_10970 [Nostocales cyanobacterium LEGE 11386]|nr:hypothetical protein [Nostocales cyanobacterium LEGE 11386]
MIKFITEFQGFEAWRCLATSGFASTRATLVGNHMPSSTLLIQDWVLIPNPQS